jgi:PAS domain S-box-containing protein
MTKSGYMLLGLTTIIAAVLAFALLRVFAAARNMAKGTRGDAGESAFMTAAMEEALARLKLREQVLAARAEASERLSDEIIASLTSGLLVVGNDHQVRSLNPSGRRLLGMPETGDRSELGDVLQRAGAPLADVIEECLSTGQPIRRRQVDLPSRGGRTTHLGVSVSPIGPGSSHGVICLFSDLTDIVELEEQLRLKDSLAQVGELTAGIASSVTASPRFTATLDCWSSKSFPRRCAPTCRASATRPTCSAPSSGTFSTSPSLRSW